LWVLCKSELGIYTARKNIELSELNILNILEGHLI